MHHIKAAILKPNGKQRTGRGFSPEELGRASLKVADARKMKIPVDLRRKSAHDENVDTLKNHLETVRTETKPRPKTEPKSSKKDRKRKA